MKQLRNIKYLSFIFILTVTGVLFFNREQLGIDFQVLMDQSLQAYEEAIGLPGDVVFVPQESNGDAGGETGTEGTLDETRSMESNRNESGEGVLPWEYTTVEETYFDDALFIGDSRTVGLSDYAELDNATFYASTGLTIYKLFTAEVVKVEDSRKKITIEEALSQRQFSKIYLMIGINEMGTGTVDTFIAKYQEALDHLQELQPDAIIYLEGIMRVSAERSAQGDYINNEGIDARNERIAQLADNQKIFYLDVNPLVCDEDGGLVASYTFDGVHLRAAYIDIWKQFLLEHAVKFL